MIRGPLTITVSEFAEKIDIDQLPEADREILAAGIHFDKTIHDAYRFFINPQFQLIEGKLPRKKKAVSFEKVNQVLVNIDRKHEGIRFIGMLPVTLYTDGSRDWDITAHAILRFVAPGWGSLELSGEGKKRVRQRRKLMIMAHRTDRNAQWVFLPDYLRNIQDFRFQLLCVVDKSVPAANRHISCSAKFTDEGRKITRMNQRKVQLPA